MPESPSPAQAHAGTRAVPAPARALEQSMRRLRPRRTAAGLLTAALVAPLLAAMPAAATAGPIAATTPGAATTPAAAPPAAAPTPAITWTACGPALPRLECGT